MHRVGVGCSVAILCLVALCQVLVGVLNQKHCILKHCSLLAQLQDSTIDGSTVIQQDATTSDFRKYIACLPCILYSSQVAAP